MSGAVLECVYKETGKNPLASVIWLHGLGADGYDFEPIVEELDLPEEMPLRFVFPHAPVRPVTVNGMMPMRAWYDIKEADLMQEEDRPGLAQSRQQVQQLIETEKKKGFDSKNIFLAGFSQGGAVSLDTVMELEEPLAGVLVLSAYLPLLTERKSAARLKSAQTPVMMMHGTQDPVVPCAQGKKSFEWLKANGCRVEWREYSMGHSVCHPQVVEIARWIQRCLGDKK